jgi:putative membrane protein
MQTLVICIDRDNDLGDKAGILTPLIGREKNIEAAVKLGSADPEDSDVNTIFGGIRVLDELREKGVDAEIVSFAGDRNVGVISDQKIARQIEETLPEFDAKTAIFVSDGAEDETLLPIVQSRIKIDSVKLIVVKQSANLESTYYIIKHAFSDPKISQTFFIPIGLAAIIYAFFLLISYPEGAIIGISAAIGAYMLYRGLNPDESFALVREKAKQSLYSGQITFIAYTIAALIALIATLQGAVELWGYYTTGGIWYYGSVTLVTVFINGTVWWYVIAVLFAHAGKIIDMKVDSRFSKRKLSPSLFTFSMGLLFWGASEYILSISSLAGDSIGFTLQYFIYSLVGSILLGLAGVKLAASDAGDGKTTVSGI